MANASPNAALERALDPWYRGFTGEARKLGRRAREDARRHNDPRTVAEADLLLAMIADDELAYDDALAHFDRAVEALTRIDGALALSTLRAVSARAVTRVSRALPGDPDATGDAVERAATAATLRAHLPPIAAPLDRYAAEAWSALAILEEAGGDAPAAVATLAAVVAAVGDEAPAVLRATLQLHLGGATERTGDLAGALAAAERCLALRIAALGSDAPRVADARFGVARVLVALGRAAEGLTAARAAMAVLSAAGLERRPRASVAWAALGVAVLHATNDLVEGSACFERAAEIEERTFGAAHLATARMLALSATAHELRGNHGRVAALLARALPALVKVNDAGLGEAISRYGMALTATGRHRDASAYAARTLAALGGSAPGGTAPSVVMACEWLIAQAALLDGRVTSATPHLRRAREAAVACEGEGSETAQRLDHHLAMIAEGARLVRPGRA